MGCLFTELVRFPSPGASGATVERSSPGTLETQLAAREHIAAYGGLQAEELPAQKDATSTRIQASSCTPYVDEWKCSRIPIPVFDNVIVVHPHIWGKDELMPKLPGGVFASEASSS